MATVLEKVKDANHFTGYIFTKIKTQSVVKRLSNQKRITVNVLFCTFTLVPLLKED